jgi:hypothetical protein
MSAMRSLQLTTSTITLLLATVALTTFFGFLWHDQPARNPNRENQD